MLRVLIVDDEPLARENLRILLETQRDIEIVGECGNAVEAIGAVHKLRPDVLFLDIQMPRISGLEMVGMLDPEHRPYIVFLTAFDEYAVKAFEEHAFDYLLKPIDMNKINQALLRVTEKIAWKQKTEEIREYWKIGKRKMVRYFWTRVLLEPGVQKQGLEEEIKQQGIAEEIQEKYCVVILHFASGKLDFGKEKEQESIYKFAMENILAEAFTEKIKMENVICWEENTGTYLGILSEFSEKETKERAARVRKIFEKYFPDALEIGYISPSVPFYEAGLEKEKIMEYDKTHIYDEGEIKEFMALLREKEASGHILDEDYILQCLNKGSRVSTL